jgi:hypothetical protein
MILVPSGGKLEYRHLSPGGITGPPVIRNLCLEASLMTLLCKEVAVAKTEDKKTG